MKIAVMMHVLLCFVNPILWNRYGSEVSSCQQTWDNHLVWPDPHPVCVALFY